MKEFGKLNFSTSFNPTSAFPLDARYYFESYAAALSAAQSAEEVGSTNTVYHYGENIVVVENGKATLYLIQPNKTLSPVGSSAIGDGKSIEVVNGIIRVIGFDEAESGAQPRKKSDGTIEWIKPGTTTVEGLETLVTGLENDVATIQNDLDAAKETITVLTSDGEGSVKKTAEDAAKAEVDRFFNETSDDGVVNTVHELIDYVAAHGQEAADMAADINKNTEAIDALVKLVGDSSVADQILSAIEDALKVEGVDKYALASDLAEAITRTTNTEKAVGVLEGKIDNKVDAVEGARLMTNEEGTKLEGIESGAQVNVIDKVSEEFTTNGKMLAVKSVAMDKIVGLPEALAELGQNQGTENVIESVTVAGVALPVEEKAVDIPMATMQSLGLVKGSDQENGISIADDGTMTINSLNVNKLTQTEGDTLVLDGGSSAN